MEAEDIQYHQNLYRQYNYKRNTYTTEHQVDKPARYDNQIESSKRNAELTLCSVFIFVVGD